MIGTAECVYETPCGWCSKWDKKCDKKAPNEITIGEQVGTFLYTRGCDHTWKLHHYTPSEIVFECDKCGATSIEPVSATTC